MRKRIGLSFTSTNYTYYKEWLNTEDIRDHYEIVELSFKQQNAELIATCDGLILTGGVDIHPSLYGGSSQYDNAPEFYQPDRDAFETYLYRYARTIQLPVLGICRGMQLINILEGGTMIQDLKEKNECHKKELTDKKHSVKVEQGSLLHTITGQVETIVNSAHHQCADPESLAPTLKPSAFAEDATIEALEFKEKQKHAFMLCVQWHPERMENRQGHPFSESIKKAFLQAVMNSSHSKISVINPANGSLLAEYNQDQQQSLDEKMMRLKKGQKPWSALEIKERISIIKKYAGLLSEHIEPLARVLTDEVGKPLQQSRNEINGSIARIEWLTGNAEKYLSEECMNATEAIREIIRYEPLGVICNISAWNYPYLVGTNVFIPALLAGNAVMYKPSEFCIGTGLQIEKLLKESGVPDDVFQVAIGEGNVGAQLLHMPFNGYFFTGSYKTGQHIYETVAPKMVVCQCELGGKDPIYITDDIADVNQVAIGTADGAFYNNGQSCCSVERIYVHEKVFDSYVAAFVNEVKSWKIGDPLQEGVYVGPVTRSSQLSFLEDQVKDAVGKGAKLLTGGKRIQGNGFYFEPTVLINVNHSMTLMKEESFGPIIGIMKVASDEEAIAMMNDTAYGLTAGVYSSSESRAEKIMKEMDSGSVYWNCCDRVSACLPWSGRKHSGFGSTLSHAGIRAFVQPKAYHLRK